MRYPIGPFRAWLDRLVAEARMEFDYRPSFGNQHKRKTETVMSPTDRVAARLGVDPTTLANWRRHDDRARVWIDERTVDEMCSREGSVHIAELYPAYRTRKPFKRPKRSRAKRRS